MKPEGAAPAQELESLYHDHFDPLARLAFLLVGSRADAEDLVHAAFLSLTERWCDVDSPRAYLRQAVVNRAADLHRSARRPLRSQPQLPLGEPEIDDTWSAIQRLTKVQRVVVILRFYEDLQLVEIARLLGRPETTVRSDLRRALLQLRKELSHG